MTTNDGIEAAGLIARAQELAPGDARVAEVAARLRGMPEVSRPPAPRPDPRPAPPPAQVERRAELPPTPPARPPTASPVVVPPGAAAPSLAARNAAGARARADQPSGGSSGVADTARTGAAGHRTPAAASHRGARAVPGAHAPPAPPPARESDDAAIRRVIATYERAIETKDLALFRTVRPSLSADEERRLRASFEQVDEQRIEIRIESIAVTGDTAVARLVRQDTVGRSGRSQTTQSTQTLRLARRGAAWVIVELGR